MALFCLVSATTVVTGGTPSSNAPPPRQNPPGQSQRPRGQNAAAGQQEYQGSFTPKQRQAILRLYQVHDASPQGQRGIPVDVVMSMPEFVGNKLIGIIIHDFTNGDTGCLHQTEFLQFCLSLSTRTSPRDKKRFLFDSFNVYDSEIFTHDEIFRLYKVLLGHVVSDDHILALAYESLRSPSLRTKGEITREEFMRIVPDSEIEDKLTIYFNMPAN